MPFDWSGTTINGNATTWGQTLTHANTFFSDVSYGQFQMTFTLTSKLTIATPADASDLAAVTTAVLAAATTAGFTPADYDVIAYFCPAGVGFLAGQSGSTFASLPPNGGVHNAGPVTFIADQYHSYGNSFVPGVVCHELCHALYALMPNGAPGNYANQFGTKLYSTLPHSSSMMMPTGVRFDPANLTFGNQVEYGNMFDTMGAGGQARGHLSARQKHALGWMGSRLQTASSSGTYALSPLESATLGTQGLILTDGTYTFWVEYRASSNQDSFIDGATIKGGVFVYVIAPGNLGNVHENVALLLDMSPASQPNSAELDPSLAVGQTFTTPGGATLRTVTATATQATVQVQALATPIATVSSPTFTNTGLAPNTTYTYRVSAIDGAGNESAQSAPLTVTTPSVVVGGSVQFRAATDFNSGTTSVSVTPTHKTTGDTMFAHVTATGASAITAPSGWTLVGAANDSTAISVSLYSKTAGASEGAAAWTCAGATSLTCEISYAIGAVTVRVAGTNKSVGTAVVATAGTGLSGLSANDEVCTFISSNAGPRPYPETGCGFGIQTVPHDWESNASITAVEAIVGRKIAIAHPQVPWDCHAGVANGDFTLSTAEPRVDYANNRLTYISWPRQLAGANTSEGSWQSVFQSTDPNTVMAAIAAGTYDAIIDGNANAYKTVGLLTGAAFVIRLFWEQNGGGVQHCIGKSANPTAYVGNYNAACQRIITRTAAITKNVYWHCNPQTPSAANAPVNARDKLYWGDSFVDFMGTELYTGTRSITQHMTDTTTGAALYTGYGPGSSHNKFIMGGECGPQVKTTELGNDAGDTAVAARVQSYIDTIPTYPGLKQFTWWNGSGPNGDSIIGDQGPKTLAKIKTFISSSYMSPSYDVTWKATS